MHHHKRARGVTQRNYSYMGHRSIGVAFQKDLIIKRFFLWMIDIREDELRIIDDEQ